MRPKDEFIYPNTSGIAFVEREFGNGSDFHKITAEVNGPTLEQQVDIDECDRGVTKGVSCGS